ncbi:MAG: hypothetical protein HQL03_15755, partial [Nitrospirae bacterium]|nr:hypothetical protein [Nitrospirota bacterium]
MADQFGLSTQQDLKSGGDGVKAYGWNVLNSANASLMDVNITNAGNLSISGSTSTNDYDPMTHPFVYQNITGDFDIDIQMTPATGIVSGLMCREPNKSAGEDWVCIVYDGNAVDWWGEVINDVVTSGNLGVSQQYFRITRVGSTFTSYSKANSGDGWTQRKIYAASGWGNTIQAGMYYKRLSGSAQVRFDYFQGSNSGGDNNTTGTVAVTLPAPTLSAGTPPSAGGSLTLPLATISSSCDQSGSFVGVTLKTPTLSASTPADANVNVALPLPTLDTFATGSNNVAGQFTLMLPQANGTELAGGVSTLSLSLRQGFFSVEATTTCPHTDIPLVAIRLEALCLTGSVATTWVKMQPL